MLNRLLIGSITAVVSISGACVYLENHINNHYNDSSVKTGSSDFPLFYTTTNMQRPLFKEGKLNFTEDSDLIDKTFSMDYNVMVFQ